MNKKTAFLILITIIIIILLSFYQNKKNIKSNKFQAHINGYIQTCLDYPKIFIYENKNWREVNTQLPLEKEFFLDGKFHEYIMCDYVVCNKIEEPLEINLIEYIKVGERKAPKEKWTKYKVPVYKTKNLRGKIKIKLNYYTNSDCTNNKTYFKIIEN